MVVICMMAQMVSETDSLILSFNTINLYLQALLNGYHFRGDITYCFIAHIFRAARGAPPCPPQIALLSVAYLGLLRFCPFGTDFCPNLFDYVLVSGLEEAIS